MSDQVTITTSESWISRLKSSISGMLTGSVLFLAAFPVLWINEGRAVRTAKGLKEGASSVVSIDSSSIDPSNEGRLVHVSGAVVTGEPLSDPAFGIRQEALQLVRKVEMFQWRETSRSTTREKLGGGRETTTTYSYDRVWSDRLIDSSGFREPAGHGNPPEMRYGQEKWVAQDARLGAFRFHAGFAERLTGAEPLRIQESDLRFESGLPHSLRDGLLYIGGDPENPETGDMRIRWEVLRPGEATVVARQHGDGFEGWQSESGTRIEMVSSGRVSADSLFQGAESGNRTLTWGLRVAGFLGMFLGLVLFFRPLAVVGHVIPLVGRLLETGLALFAGVVAGVLSLVVIALGWLAWRPLVAVTLLAAAAGVGIGARALVRRRQAASAPAPDLPQFSSHT
jgi:hypothetical protein